MKKKTQSKKLTKEQRREVERIVSQERNTTVRPPKNYARLGNRARKGHEVQGSCMSPICKSVCDNLVHGASSIFLPTSSYSWDGNNAEHRLPGSELFGITYQSKKTVYMTKQGAGPAPGPSTTCWFMICLQQTGGQRTSMYYTNNAWNSTGVNVPATTATGITATTVGLDEPYDGSTLGSDVYTFVRSLTVTLQLTTEQLLQREGKIFTFMTHRPPAALGAVNYEAFPSYAVYSTSILNPASRIAFKPPLRNSAYIGAKNSTGYDWMVIGVSGLPGSVAPEFGITVSYEAAIVGTGVPPSIAFQVAPQEWQMAASAHTAALGPTFSYLVADAGVRGEEYRKNVVAGAVASIPSFVAKASAELVKPQDSGWIKSITDGLSVLETGARTLATLATL